MIAISKEVRYLDEIKTYRKDFVKSDIVSRLASFRIEPDLFGLFLIYYCGLNQYLVRPIDLYLKRAGERCRQLQFDEFSDFFGKHAREEEGHDAWAVRDTRRLIEIWNARSSIPLRPEDLTRHEKHPAIARYHRLHEDVIASETPFGILAIASEVEWITVQHGPRLLLHALFKAGPDMTSRLSFIFRHVKADIGHHSENKGMLARALAKDPGRLRALVRTGRRALEIYSEFLTVCLDYAQDALRRSR